MHAVKSGATQYIRERAEVTAAWREWLDTQPEDVRVEMHRGGPRQVYYGQRQPEEVQVPERFRSSALDASVPTLELDYGSDSGYDDATGDDLGTSWLEDGRYNLWGQRTPQQRALSDGVLAYLELNPLPERQADAIRLRHFAQLTIDQVAQHMGISKASAQNHLNRAHAKLREGLLRAFGPQPQVESYEDAYK